MPGDDPSGATRIIVGVPEGGPLDIAAQLIAPWLAHRLGQPCVVENLVGDRSNLAARTVRDSAPDGRTLLLCGPVYPINNALDPDLDFDFLRDFEQVAGLFRVPLVVEVNPSLSIKNVPELLACAKAKPMGLRLAYAGIGTPQHIGIELFKSLTGADFTMVSYLGSAPALTDMLAGHADLMFDPLPSSAELARSGRLRPLAVTSAKPSRILPGVPCMCEFLPGYEAGSWFGLSAAKNTPAQVVAELNEAINLGLMDSKLASRIVELGGMEIGGDAAAFAEFVAAETSKYRKIIHSADIRAM